MPANDPSSGEGATASELGGVRAARLRAVLSAIAARAGDPAFGVEAAAATLGVTARYVQQVLAETGATFSEHLSDQRLRTAWQLLTDPRGRGEKIATVAFECGFGDLSTFNRAFRRRFGETPMAVRGAAHGGHDPATRETPSRSPGGERGGARAASGRLPERAKAGHVASACVPPQDNFPCILIIFLDGPSSGHGMDASR